MSYYAPEAHIYIKAPLYPARPKATQRDYDPPPAPTPGSCQAQGQRSEGPARPPHLPINGVVWLGPGYRNHGPIRARNLRAGCAQAAPPGRRGDLRPQPGRPLFVRARPDGWNPTSTARHLRPYRASDPRGPSAQRRRYLHRPTRGHAAVVCVAHLRLEWELRWARR